jgi:hypothetical protein
MSIDKLTMGLAGAFQNVDISELLRNGNALWLYCQYVWCPLRLGILQHYDDQIYELNPQI